MLPPPVSSLRGRRLAVGVVLALFLSVAAVVVQPSRSDAVPVWVDGSIVRSTILNCVTFTPEYGVGTYAGAVVDPDTLEPKVGQRFYVRVVVVGMGQACDTQIFDLQFALPQGVEPAIAPDYGIVCSYDGQQLPVSQCPQTLQPGWESGYYRFPAPTNAGIPTAPFWPATIGEFYEFLFPVASDVVIEGNQAVRGRVEVADGFDNPVLRPSADLWVFPAQTTTTSSTTTTTRPTTTSSTTTTQPTTTTTSQPTTTSSTTTTSQPTTTSSTTTTSQPTTTSSTTTSQPTTTSRPTTTSSEVTTTTGDDPVTTTVEEPVTSTTGGGSLGGSVDGTDPPDPPGGAGGTTDPADARPQRPASGRLSRTGTRTAPLAALGASAVTLGAVLVTTARRRRRPL